MFDTTATRKKKTLLSKIIAEKLYKKKSHEQIQPFESSQQALSSQRKWNI